MQVYIIMLYDCSYCVQESNLALHSDGIKMTLGSERPHLLAVDNDAFGGGIVIYHLKVRVYST